ncbi:hypothetical protein DMN91_008040 [Ooceraea biroi]|uniref:COX assembly mitochondrial protein n=1 Tax=Ooceraea biroi TaxID=2015173 RepID=A0A3L8DH30_OOCBI|nr:COX assembly mitochondrial protein 2 homolog [Ooceraea biroi]RLU19483.1 hypothetical protein DMN91_008040 [Ooceraea biroi]
MLTITHDTINCYGFSPVRWCIDRSLAVHNAECNWIFRKYQDCESEHPYGRFLGYCGQIHKEMIECIKEQRQIRRQANLDQARRKYEKKISSPKSSD